MSVGVRRARALRFDRLEDRWCFAADSLSACGLHDAVEVAPSTHRQDSVDTFAFAPAAMIGPLAAAPAPARHLVMVTHGWRGNTDDWPRRMQENIAEQLHLRPQVDLSEVVSLQWSELQETLPHAAMVDGMDQLWEVVTFDWRKSAAVFFPTSAGESAAAIGTRYAAQIAQQSYATVHLITHSAGSWMIDAMANSIEQLAPSTVTQLTFLDAYTPADQRTTFGSTADWAEHYVDKGVLPYTNDDFTHAINIDLSLWGPSTSADSLSFGASGHAWPWEWYLGTTDDPTSSRWGFANSISMGQSPPDPTSVGSVIVLGHPGDANDDGLFDSSDFITMFQAGKFETGQPARRTEGDWDGNGFFETSDLVVVFQAGTYVV